MLLFFAAYISVPTAPPTIGETSVGSIGWAELSIWGLPVLTGLLALAGVHFGNKLVKRTEHEQWLRNEKQRVYSETIAEFSRLRQEVFMAWRPDYSGTSAEALEIVKFWGESELEILAPEKMVQTANDVRTELRRVMWMTYADNANDESREEASVHFNAAEKSLKRLKNEMRRDLGADSKDA